MEVHEQSESLHVLGIWTQQQEREQSPSTISDARAECRLPRLSHVTRVEGFFFIPHLFPFSSLSHTGVFLEGGGGNCGLCWGSFFSSRFTWAPILLYFGRLIACRASFLYIVRYTVECTCDWSE